MRRVIFWIFLSIVYLPLAASAQEPMSEAQGTETSLDAGAPSALARLGTQWLWGEVSSLDVPNNKITINYFDYETDAEKAAIISVDADTKYENIRSLNDLNLNDSISVDYALSADGKYIAENISIERLQETSALPVSATVPVTP